MFRVAQFSPSRRQFTIGAAALLLSTAAGPAFAKSVSSFIDGLWTQAKARGVPKKVFDAAMGGFKPIPEVLELANKQPEFLWTAADYINKRVNDKQIATGRGMASEWSKTLSKVEGRWGVQSEAVLAIWGIETNYGSFMGGNNTIHALATLSYGGYRVDYFHGELLTALQVLAQGHVKADQMVGSWAGAMGHPQFMPSSFMRFAVDFKGEGKKDIWNSVPDAQASTANYLKEHGWRAGETWGYEIKLPQGFNYMNVWSGVEASIGDWADAGLTRASGKAFPRRGDSAKIFMPMGGNGPVFLVLANFGVIKRYNNSDSYALAVGHLADRILGGGSIIAAWPEDTALKKEGRTEVQQLLLRKGYDIGSADGVLGPKTRGAIIDWQTRKGLFPDGHAGGNLLKALRG